MKKLITFCFTVLLTNSWAQCANAVSPVSQSVTCAGGGTSVSFTASAISPTINIRHDWYSPLNPLPGGTPILTSTNAVSVLSGSFSPGEYTVVTTDLGSLCQVSKTFTITSPIDVYPTFGVASSTNFSVGCSGNQTTLSILNPISTQTPPATCSFTFLPPGFAGTLGIGPYNANTSTVTSMVGTWTFIVNDNSNNCKTLYPVSVFASTMSANFTHTVSGGGQVFFTSASTGTNAGTTYSWDFGDGTTGAGQSTSHTYSNGGIHNITLTTSGNNCYTTLPVNVNTIPCNANAGYSLTYSGIPQNWYAAPNYYGNVTNAIWNWGDGSSDNIMFPVHTYSAAGLYNICLSVTVSCASSASFCSNYSIYKTVEANMAMVTVSVVSSIPLGINEFKIKNEELKIYPNPVNDNLYINSIYDNPGSEYKNISIYNNLGQLIREEELTFKDKVAVLKTNALPDGVYILKLKGGSISSANANLQTVSKKFVIAR